MLSVAQDVERRSTIYNNKYNILGNISCATLIIYSTIIHVITATNSLRIKFLAMVITSASMASDKEWLRKNIEDRSIRFYSFDEFVDPIYIGGGGYGVVFKAKMKTLGRTVAY